MYMTEEQLAMLLTSSITATQGLAATSEQVDLLLRQSTTLRPYMMTGFQCHQQLMMRL